MHAHALRWLSLQAVLAGQQCRGGERTSHSSDHRDSFSSAGATTPGGATRQLPGYRPAYACACVERAAPAREVEAWKCCGDIFLSQPAQQRSANKGLQTNNKGPQTSKGLQTNKGPWQASHGKCVHACAHTGAHTLHALTHSSMRAHICTHVRTHTLQHARTRTYAHTAHCL